MAILENNISKDLASAFSALTSKVSGYDTLFDYYDGDQPLKYNSTRLQTVFKRLDVQFTENWCAVVIDSTYNRINLQSVSIAEKQDMKSNIFEAAIARIKARLEGSPDKIQEKIDELIERNEIMLESDLLHRVAGITGESFYIVSRDETGAVNGWYNDPRLVHIFYDEQNPRKKKYAAKWWKDAEGKTRMVLYYPDRFEYYKTVGKSENITSASQFTPCDKDGNLVSDDSYIEINESGEIPVFHFRVDRRATKSDLKNTIPIQDAVNKLVQDMLIVSEFGAFRQKWIISNADISSLKNAPNEVWDLPAGNGEGQQTQVGDFEANDPENYIKSIDREVNVISAITSTPKHFFFDTGSSQISGEALITMEAPLNDKAKKRTELFVPVWKEIFIYMLKLAGSDKVEKQSLVISFDEPQTVQPKTEAEIIGLLVTAGIPLVTALRDAGWEQSKIDQMIVDLQEQRDVESTSLAESLLRAERNFSDPDKNDI